MNSRQQNITDFIPTIIQQQELKQNSQELDSSTVEILKRKENIRFADFEVEPEFVEEKNDHLLQFLTIDELKMIPRYICSMPNASRTLPKLNEKISALNVLFEKKMKKSKNVNVLISVNELKAAGWIWDVNSKALISILR